MKKFKRLSVLIDNPDSWFNMYTDELAKILEKYCVEVVFLQNQNELLRGDILFILSCTKILKKKALSFHGNNIVVHASDLPAGKGWSPWAWQVEKGINDITLTLFEASTEPDSGGYYIKDHVCLNGTELIDLIRLKIEKKIIEMIEQFLSKYPIKVISQKGKETFYRRRRYKDNELDIKETIESQFNKMRVADNEKYPLFFLMRGKRYKFKIYEYPESE